MWHIKQQYRELTCGKSVKFQLTHKWLISIPESIKIIQLSSVSNPEKCSFLAGNFKLNVPHKSIMTTRCILPRWQCQWLFISDRRVFMGYTLKIIQRYKQNNMYIYICIYIYINFIYKNSHKKAVLLPIKSSSDDDPEFRHGFGPKASLPLTQGAPAVSHNTNRLYWMVYDLYECHIRSDAVTALFWIFFIYSLFFAGESMSLVKIEGVEFEIKPRHSISRRNMSVDEPSLILCLCRSLYFWISADAPSQCWPQKGSLI